MCYIIDWGFHIIALGLITTSVACVKALAIIIKITISMYACSCELMYFNLLYDVYF